MKLRIVQFSQTFCHVIPLHLLKQSKIISRSDHLTAWISTNKRHEMISVPLVYILHSKQIGYIAIYISICLSVCLSISIYGSAVLFLLIGRFYSFLILYSVGCTPWTADQLVARPLPIHRTKAHRHPCFQWDSNPRSQYSDDRRQFLP
jgi:hypothetical protein